MPQAAGREEFEDAGVGMDGRCRGTRGDPLDRERPGKNLVSEPATPFAGDVRPATATTTMTGVM